MSGHPAEPMLDVTGTAAPPRRNGELVFAAPWESRVFGVTLALHEARLFDWEEFRQRLIAEIGASERHGGGASSYYACWMAALEKLLAARGVCESTAIDARQRELAARPPGHDHSPPT